MKKIFALAIVMAFLLNLGVNKASADSTVTEGAWFGSWSSYESQHVENFEAMTQTKLGIVQTFVNTNMTLADFGPTLNYVDSKGAMNLVTLTPHGYTTKEINNGKLDKYYTNLAKQFKEWNNGKEVWIRFLHEGNGNWYSWSIGDSRVNTNESYKAAYRRVVDIFRKQGAVNVKWVYNVNNANIGKNTSFTDAYPGNDYIDYVSIDGYNWGTATSWSKETSFREVFDKAYEALLPLGKPLLITELGCSETGTNKAAWVKEAYAQIKSGAYQNLKALVWFNENKEYDWRINSSEAALTAYINK